MRRLAIILVPLIIAGCSSTKQTTTESATPEAGEDLAKYEASFRPSDYDEEPAAAAKSHDVHTVHDTAASNAVGPTIPQEPVAGFRVQIFASTNIDVAKAKQLEAQALFPGEWFYLEYDQPTYKIRAGNFLSRFEADRFAKLIAEKGFREAWTVPEKVFKQPPPPPQLPVKEEPANPK